MFALLCLSREVRRRFGPVGWFLTGYIVVLLIFLLKGMPAVLAKALFLSYSPARSADIGLGVASIILTIHTLAVVRQVRASGDAIIRGRMRFVAVGVAVVGPGDLLVSRLQASEAGRQGADAQRSRSRCRPSWRACPGRWPRGVRCCSGCRSRCSRVSTCFWFNPLATNLDHVYESELAHAIRDVKAHAGSRSTWAVFGGIHIGPLIEILGDRALTGPQWPPQLHAWSVLDPEGAEFANYNRYAEVAFNVSNDPQAIRFENPNEGYLNVTLVARQSPPQAARGALRVAGRWPATGPCDATKFRIVYHVSERPLHDLRAPLTLRRAREWV